jgi:hypothetical protein
VVGRGVCRESTFEPREALGIIRALFGLSVSILSVGLIAPDFASCVQDRKLVISFGTMSVSRTL